jgi:SAM-dependent methyltransferase
MSTGAPSMFEHDAELTRANRVRLRGNPNLMLWYETLYRELFRSVQAIGSKRILEIGSGTSPLKQFVPNVITSDVLPMDYLDLVFDCHDIAEVTAIPDHSIDLIALTNVLHHLRDPLLFLRRATRKLVPGGEVYIVEPYFSLMSYPLYKLLHTEPVDFRIRRPRIERVEGPLSTSNQAMAHMIFYSRRQWLQELSDCYDLEQTRRDHFTGLAYMVTGGISRTFPVPGWIYRPFLACDRVAAQLLPKLFASFFTARLVARLDR